MSMISRLERTQRILKFVERVHVWRPTKFRCRRCAVSRRFQWRVTNSRTNRSCGKVYGRFGWQTASSGTNTSRIWTNSTTWSGNGTGEEERHSWWSIWETEKKIRIEWRNWVYLTSVAICRENWLTQVCPCSNSWYRDKFWPEFSCWLPYVYQRAWMNSSALKSLSCVRKRRSNLNFSLFSL